MCNVADKIPPSLAVSEQALPVTDFDLLSKLDGFRERFELEVKREALGEVEGDDVAIEAAASELKGLLVHWPERKDVVLSG